MMRSMKAWNRMMRATNGNGPRRQWIKVTFQNIPLGLSINNKEDIIDRILRSYRPHLLGLAEPRTSKLSKMFFDGYSFVPGKALGISDSRLNVLIKDGLIVEYMKFETEIPSLLIKVDEVHVLLGYCEWNHPTDHPTTPPPHQKLFKCLKLHNLL